jgi:hypothetical protein
VDDIKRKQAAGKIGGSVPIARPNGELVSNSSLGAATRSMQHYRHQQPIEDSPCLRFGRACHTAKFEPLLLLEEYVVMPAFELQVTNKPGDNLHRRPDLQYVCNSQQLLWFNNADGWR